MVKYLASNKVSFDFDGTLDRESLQYLVKDLQEADFEIYVTTARFSDERRKEYPFHPSNDDLWELVDKLDIPRKNVNFTNSELKWEFIKTQDFIAHFDDLFLDIKALNENTSTFGIYVRGGNNFTKEFKIKIDSLSKLQYGRQRNLISREEYKKAFDILQKTYLGLEQLFDLDTEDGIDFVVKLIEKIEDDI